MKNRFLLVISLLIISLSSGVDPARSQEVLFISQDSNHQYSRIAFKHWIDADKNKCNTRAEVLIAEAIRKPKVNPKNCAVTGGTWLSPYDKKVQNKASSLDIDHLVPLAEAWRSGAWNWTAAEREAFANDLKNPEVLVAVTLNLNRSKGDKDVSAWLPPSNRCSYIEGWIKIKVIYKLTVDPTEAKTLTDWISNCGISNIEIGGSPSSTPNSISPPTSTPSTTSSLKPTQGISNPNEITPGAFCSQAEAGTLATNSSGVTYTCKVSTTENRLRWRK